MQSGSPRAVAVLFAAALSCPPVFASSPGEDRLAAGIALIKNGDFTSAIDPLAAAIQRLGAESGHKEQLASAYLYLGIAYLELGQELEAQGKFREAIRIEPGLKLSPDQFSAQQIRVFEAARQQKKKKLPLPLILVLGGGAASAGVAVAASGGGSSGSPTTTAVGAATTSTQPSGGGGGTTTTTLGSGPTTTRPSATTTTTTTLPGATTTTTTTLPSPTTTTTTTTMPQSCTYSASPAQQNFGLAAGSGNCNISATPSTCSWSVQKAPSNASWLGFTSPTSGTGGATVSFHYDALLLGSRSVFIRIVQDPNKGCNVTQGGLVLGEAPIHLDSHFDAPGARGQIVVNGSDVAFQSTSLLNHATPAKPGTNRIEAIVVKADGKPGTWRFDLRSGYVPGSLVSLTGAAAFPTPGSIVFQVTGEAGERFVFQFQGRAEP